MVFPDHTHFLLINIDKIYGHIPKNNLWTNQFTLIYFTGHAFHVRSCYPGQKTGCFNRDNVTDAHVLECYCNEDFCNRAGRFVPCGVVSILTKFFMLIILVIK